MSAYVYVGVVFAFATQKGFAMFTWLDELRTRYASAAGALAAPAGLFHIPILSFFNSTKCDTLGGVAALLVVHVCFLSMPTVSYPCPLIFILVKR